MTQEVKEMKEKRQYLGKTIVQMNFSYFDSLLISLLECTDPGH